MIPNIPLSLVEISGLGFLVEFDDEKQGLVCMT